MALFPLPAVQLVRICLPLRLTALFQPRTLPDSPPRLLVVTVAVAAAHREARLSKLLDLTR